MIENIKVDVTDKTKSVAVVTIGETTATVEYWYSINKQCGDNIDAYLISEANIQLGNVSDAIEILNPLATGEDTTFFEQTVDAEGNPFTNFGGADTRNWAQKRIDELN
jgi:hypothetical protein